MASSDLNQLFNQLLEFQWKSVPFPAVSFSVDLRQDLAVHRYSDKDGAHVEATGRAPMIFKARIPFLNSIVPGVSESWGSLYPDGFRAFMSAAADRTRGPLQHPEFGIVQCQLETAQVVWDAEHATSGVFVDATWIESTFTPEESANIFSAPSPIGVSILSALDLDAELTSFSPALPPALGQPSLSFEDAMRSIQAIGDQASLLAKRVGGTVDSVAYRVNNISQSLDTAVTTVTNGNCSTTFKSGALQGVTANGPAALFWPMRTSVTAMQVSLSDLKKQILTAKRAIGLYTVPLDATLASISVDIGAQLTDLITLNKQLISSPIVSAGTVVRHYTP